MIISLMRHELGHWLTAQALGFEVGEIRVHRQDNGALHASAQCFPLTKLYGKNRKTIQYCERRVCILLGGVCAELLFDSNQTSQNSVRMLETTASDDYGKIIELVHLVASTRNVSELNFQDFQQDLIAECWRSAATILEPRREDILIASQLMAKRFERKGSVIFSKEKVIEYTQA